MPPAPHATALAELDRRHVFHPFTSIAAQVASPPRVLVEGKGVWVRDAEGREYLDAMAGLFCVAAGYGREEIAAAMADQARRLGYAHAFLGQATEPGIRLAARLAGLAPAGLGHAFFCNSGSEAVETALKLVRYHWNLRGRREKKKIVGRRGGYHGVTLGAASVSGLSHLHAHFDLPLPGFLHVTKPHHYRVADRAARTPFPASDRVGMRLHEILLEEGLLCRAIGDALAFSPPLSIAEDELAEAVRRFARGLERLHGELRGAPSAGARRAEETQEPRRSP
jgi:adenosylmethionine-8-amino-7-oxononanoate aminotransferase